MFNLCLLNNKNKVSFLESVAPCLSHYAVCLIKCCPAFLFHGPLSDNNSLRLQAVIPKRDVDKEKKEKDKGCISGFPQTRA